MIHSNRNLAALVGSRICHDLISPIGAIANGLELLAMSGISPGPEFSLVSKSAASANARIRFFRIAFGVTQTAGGETAETPLLGPEEITEVLQGVYGGGSRSVETALEGALPRRAAQLLFLALMCAEQAIPYGGRLEAGGGAKTLSIGAQGDRLVLQPGHWETLTAAPGARGDLPAAQVQFSLLPAVLDDMGGTLTLTRGEGRIGLDIGL